MLFQSLILRRLSNQAFSYSALNTNRVIENFQVS